MFIGNVKLLSKSAAKYYSCEPTARQQHRQVNLGRNKVSQESYPFARACNGITNILQKIGGTIKGDPTIENSRCLIAFTYRPYAGVHDFVAIHYGAGRHPHHPSAFAVTFALRASPIITVTYIYQHICKRMSFRKGWT